MEQTVETVNLYQIITLFIIELVCNDNVKHINNFKIEEGEFYKKVFENLSFDKTIRQFIKTFNQNSETNIIKHFSLYGVFNREINDINSYIQTNALKVKEKNLNTNIIFKTEYKTIVGIIFSIILDISCKSVFSWYSLD